MLTERARHAGPARRSAKSAWPDTFDRAAAEVGLESLTPRPFRRTAASLAIADGADVKAVQRMLGHASAAMTLDVYAGLFGDDLDDLARRLDEAATSSRADQVRTRSAADDLDRWVPPAPQASDAKIQPATAVGSGLRVTV